MMSVVVGATNNVGIIMMHVIIIIIIIIIIIMAQIQHFVGVANNVVHYVM
jgi:hypothetical protein